VQVDDVVDEVSQRVVTPAEPSEVYLVVRVLTAEDVACESVELIMGNGVEAELPALVEIPFALPVVRKVLDTSDQDGVVSEECADAKVVFIHGEVVEVIAASDTRDVLPPLRVVVRNKVVVLVYETDDEESLVKFWKRRWDVLGSAKVVVMNSVVVRV